MRLAVLSLYRRCLRVASFCAEDHRSWMSSYVRIRFRDDAIVRGGGPTKVMRHLREAHPEVVFSIIMGQDNLTSFHTWKDHESLVTAHRLLIYPRLNPGAKAPPPSPTDWLAHPSVEVHQAPLIAISSTYIRDAIMAGHDVQFLLPDAVVAYIGNNHFYEED